MPTTPGLKAFQRRFWQTVQGKLLLLLCTLLIPTLLIQAYIYHDRFQTRRVEELQANLEIARAVAKAFDSFVQDVLHQELSIGLAFTSSQPLSDEDKNGTLFRNQAGNPAIWHFFWDNPAGVVVAATGSQFIGMDISDREFYREIVAGKDWVVSDLLLSKTTLQPSFTISRGIRNERGALLGIIVAGILPERLEQVLGIKRSEGGGVSLLDTQGRLVYRFPEAKVSWEERDWLNYYPEQVRAALNGKEVTDAVFARHSQKQRLVGFAPVTSIGWATGAGRTEEVAMAAITSTLRPQALLFLLATIVVFGIALFFSFRISASIAQLREHALALGRGDNQTPVVVSGTIELDDLANALNKMSDELQARENERKQGERTLRESEARFRARVQASSDVVYRMSPDWGEMRYLHGREFISDTETPSSTWLQQYIHPDDQSFVTASINEAIRNKSIFELEHRVLRVDGSLGWMSLRAIPLQDQNGEIVEWFGAASNITERKQMEEALRASERLYRTIGESIDYGVWVCASDGRNTYASESFLKLVGITQQECSDFAWGDVLHPEDAERTIAAWKKCVRTGETWDIEHRFRGVDGQWHPVLARGNPIRDESGEIVSWAGINLDIAVLKRMEEELRKSRDELELRVQERTTELLKVNENLEEKAALLDLAHDAILVRDLHDQVVYWSSGAEKTYGWTQDEVRGKVSYDLLQTRFPQPSAEIRARLLEKGRWEGELDHITRDGSRIIVESRQALQRNLDGDPAGVLEINRDITNRKRAEEQLRQASQYSRSLIEASLDPLVTISPEGKITDINEATIKVTGVPREGLLGSDFSKYFTEPEKATEGYRQVFEKGFVTDYALTIRHKNGRLEDVLYNASVYKDRRGDVLGVFAAARDITKRKRAEEELAKANAMLETVFDGISDPLLMVEKDCRIRMLNGAACKYFHIATREDAIGKTCYEVTFGERAPCDICHMSSVIPDGKKTTFDRKGVFDPERIEQITVYPVDEAIIGVSGAIMRISDITESRNMEKQLTRADRLSSMGVLAGGIAHEIRNPLHAMSLFLDVLTDEEKFSRTSQELNVFQEIKINIKRIDGIIRRVLDFSRQTASISQKIEPSVLIEQSLELWKSKMAKSGIKLGLLVEENLPEVLGDRIEIQQVLTNLVQNAVEAMKQNGALAIIAESGTLSFDKKRPAVIIKVQDSGPGIPLDQQKNIFTPFFTTKYTGTGLGLAISHRIISRHGGLISFESVPDEGTTFTVELPVAPES
jgi:PAS domain S-box-containing protein